MIQIGDTVRIGESGETYFVVQEVDEVEGRAVIEPADEAAAGRYPFSMPLRALVKVEG
ncbi:hypothetical protein [Micromonospora sp. NPDC048169]|uniref:hypothetical protein n=1 Tax=Micromonospora sp. NPDC048169 TaxID=3154711 RepID=UPI0033D11446